MTNYDDTAHPAVGLILASGGDDTSSGKADRTIPTTTDRGRPHEFLAAATGNSEGWVKCSYKPVKEIRETRVVALRRDVESGHYSVKAEQVAEKLMQDHLLELFYS